MPRPRASRTPASSGPTRPFRSWRCRMRPGAAHARVDAARTSDQNRLQRHRIQPVGGRDPRRGVAAFPRREITYKIDEKRQGIVDSWPADVDDSAARTDWGFRPEYDFDRAFREYLIPTISTYYRS